MEDHQSRPTINPQPIVRFIGVTPHSSDTLILESEKVAFLRPLPVRRLHGVGEVTEQALRGAGIHTIGDLEDYRGDLQPVLGQARHHLQRFARGEDHRVVEPEADSKSISCEETFEHNTTDMAFLHGCIWRQAGELAGELAKTGTRARTVCVKVTYGDFRSLTRQITLERWHADATQFYMPALLLIKQHRLFIHPVRLLGLGVANLQREDPRQLPLL